MNKKAQIQDLYVNYILILFVMAIVIVVFAYTWKQINTGWSSSSDIPQVSKDIINLQATKFPIIWDFWIVVAVIGYIIALVISAMSIRSHPVFAILALVVLITIGVVAVKLSNAFYTFASSSDLSTTVAELPKIVFVMNKLPIFVVVLGLIFIVILYAKTRQQIPTL